MKYSIYASIEQELEKAIVDLQSIPPSTDHHENHHVQPCDDPIARLTKMSYLLKFRPGNYFSHLKPDLSRFP